MVVESKTLSLSDLDLGHLALFVGLRVNELVVAEMKRAGFKGVRESHGFVIQHLIDSERSITELARRMGISQQAASKTVAELVGLGVLEESRGQDRRSKRICLSKRGWEGVHASRDIRAKIHRRLTLRVRGEYERTQQTLLACLEELGGTGRIRNRRIRQPN